MTALGTPDTSIGIIGLGDVGLPPTRAFAGAGLHVRDAVRRRLDGSTSGSVPTNVDVL